MKKRLSLLLISALLLGSFSGCAKEIDNSGYVPTGDAILLEGMEPEDILPPEENTQELSLAYYPERSMNPLFGSDFTNRTLFSLIYQGLFSVDSTYEPHPILCSRYEVTSDFRTWTFYLENNATFSDGTRVTNADVIATYNRAMENDYFKGRFFHLDRVEEGSDGGIVFFLTTPIAELPILLDVPIVKAGEVDADHPLGTGPYIYEEGGLGSTLRRNPGWWCGETEFSVTDLSITLIPAGTPAEVRDEFEFGEVGLVCTNPQSDAYADYRSDYELWEVDNGYFIFIGCNITYSPFFEDGTLRTMLTYAIDRATLVEEHYDGKAYPVTLPCSPLSPFYSQSLAKNYEFDELKFMELMGNYDIPEDDKGREKPLRLLVNSDDSARLRCARDIAASLTEMGLACETLECNTQTFKDVLRAQNFDIYLGATKLSATMDLTEFFRPWGEMGDGGIANPIIYQMMLNALEDRGNYYNLYKKLADDGRIVPVLFGYHAVYAERGLLTDLNPSRDNIFFYTLGKTMDGIQMETVYE